MSLAADPSNTRGGQGGGAAERAIADLETDNVALLGRDKNRCHGWVKWNAIGGRGAGAAEHAVADLKADDVALVERYKFMSG